MAAASAFRSPKPRPAGNGRFHSRASAVLKGRPKRPQPQACPPSFADTLPPGGGGRRQRRGAHSKAAPFPAPPKFGVPLKPQFPAEAGNRAGGDVAEGRQLPDPIPRTASRFSRRVWAIALLVEPSFRWPTPSKRTPAVCRRSFQGLLWRFGCLQARQA